MTSRSRRPALTDAQRKRIAAAYEAGVTLRELARAYRCSTAPIIAALEEHGVPRRPTNNPAGRPKEVA